MITVPLIHGANQGRALVLGYVAFTALYLGTGTFHVRAPFALVPADLDMAIPFVEWTVWVYLTQFLLLPAGIVSARDDFDRSRAFYAMLAATMLAAAVFVIWPTQLQRQAVPATGLTGFVWSALYFTDTPSNCLPSLHAALAVIAGAALWRRGWRVAALVWPALIVLSALTTKQHVVWDVAGGLALAALVWTLTPRFLRYERPQSIRDTARA
jgi:membrane-associated phospholipid phosphatase